MELTKSSDVLDVTHVIRNRFRAEIIGYFRRMGPNPWDDYQFVRLSAPNGAADQTRAGEFHVGELPQTLELLPQVPLQLEAHGPVVRVRSCGSVVRARWIVAPVDAVALRQGAEPSEIRNYFVHTYLGMISPEAALGATAVIAKKLGDT